MRRSRVFWRRPARIERPTLLLSFALPVSATSGPSVFVPPLTPPHLLFIQSTLHRSTNSSPLLFRFRSDSALDAFCVSPPAPTLSLRAKKQKNLLLLPTPPPPLGSSVSFAIFIRRSAQKLFPSVLFSPPLFTHPHQSARCSLGQKIRFRHHLHSKDVRLRVIPSWPLSLGECNFHWLLPLFCSGNVSVDGMCVRAHRHFSRLFIFYLCGGYNTITHFRLPLSLSFDNRSAFVCI